MLKTTMLGHLGKDAEMKFLQDGSIVINFNCASSECWKDKEGNKKERTTWVSCSMFFAKDKNPKIFDYLNKGQQVWMEGTPTSSAYNGKDGKLYSELKLRVDNLLLVGKSKESGTSEAIEEQSTNDDLPY